MLHPLQAAVRQVGRRAQRLLLVRGVAISLSAALLAALLCGSADYLWRPTDRVLRSGLTIAVVVPCLVAFARFVWPVLTWRRQDVAVARWIERSVPACGDQLSTALAFLQTTATDAASGSPTLRAAHVAAVTDKLRHWETARSLRWTLPLRSLALCVAVCSAVVAICGTQPAEARLAGLRLLLPWNELAWPRRHELAVADAPDRLAVGQDFQAIVVDRRGELPEAVTFHFAYLEDADSAIQQAPMQYVGGRMVYRLANVTRSLRYRATGGDDEAMPWHEVRIVEPPQVTAFRVRVTPPSYTGLPAAEGNAPVRAWQGSRVEFSGSFSEPVANLALKTEPADLFAGCPQPAAPVRLESDRRSFVTGQESASPWTVAQSGKFWLEVTTIDGVSVSTRTWDVLALQDQPPAVRVAPLTRGGVATPQADLPLIARTHDDLAIRAVDLLVHSNVEPTRELTQRIWEGPAEPPPPAVADGKVSGEDRPAETVFSLAATHAQPGQQLEFEVVAEDYRPQTGRGEKQLVRVIGLEEYQQRIDHLQAALLPIVQQATQTQREARSRAQSLQAHAKERRDWTQLQSDQLRAADLQQRRVAQLLVEPQEGLLPQVRGIQSEIQVNKLGLPDVQRRLATLEQAANSLHGTTLPQAQQKLTDSLQEMPTGKLPTEPASERLLRAFDELAAAQTTSLQRLEELSALLAEWEGYRRFATEVGELLGEQEQLRAATTEVRSSTLGRDVSELAPAERLELRRLAGDQLDVARRFDQLRSRMDSSARQLAATDPVAAQTLQDGLEAARRQDIGSKMRDTARELENNQVGQALAAQEKAARGLREVLEALARRGSQPEARRQQLVGDAAAAVGNLRRRQQELSDARGQLDTQRNDASDEAVAQVSGRQRDLAAETNRIATHLQNLRHLDSARQVADAAKAMIDSAAQLDAREFAQADQAAATAAQALANAEALLRQDLAQQQQAASQQRRAELANRIGPLVREQTALLDATAKLESLRESQSLWSPEQQSSVRGLGLQQTQLAEQTGALTQWAAGMPVVEFQLRRIREPMGEAAEALGRLETGPHVQSVEGLALERLQQLQQALAASQVLPDGSAAGKSLPEMPTAELSADDQAASATQLAVEELELLKLLQENLLARTEALDQRREKQDPAETAAIGRESQALAAEQQALSDLFEQLLGNAVGTEKEE